MSNPAKIWKISAAMLVLLNLGLLFTIWFKPGAGRERMPGLSDGVQGDDPITEQLGFNEKQISGFQKLKKIHHDSVKKLLRAGHELRNVFFNQLKTDSS